MTTPPDWIRQLADQVAACLEPLEPMPPLGCHYHAVDDCWEISLFPSQTEIVGGAQDGLHIAPRLRVDLLEITSLFDAIEDISWQTRAVDETDELGCHIAISGILDGRRIEVRVLRRSPACFDPGRKAYIHEGCLLETW